MCTIVQYTIIEAEKPNKKRKFCANEQMAAQKEIRPGLGLIPRPAQIDNPPVPPYQYKNASVPHDTPGAARANCCPYQ
jgi:hypothetical protein